MFNGLNMNLGNLAMLSDAKTRSISAENPKGGKGDGTKEPGSSHLGVGWKARPSVDIEPHTTFEIADIDGSGVIQSIWCTGGYVGTELIFSYLLGWSGTAFC